ncbi:hypothetical protein [Pseudooctadecabacter sp.]|uniref:hypothetical protein n=1 Tax=Pseudooctadecabacter sp. TaxID=1966338 RepID=UPI0035C8047D
MRLIALCLIGYASGAAASCPDPTQDAPRFEATGPDLIAPKSWPIEVAGERIAPCAQWVLQGTAPVDLDGYLPVAPTAVFDLEGMGPHILMVMAEAQCAPILAVRSADGLWHVGETANDREEVVVWGAPDGPLQVWVGAREQTTCEGTVTLETFDR